MSSQQNNLNSHSLISGCDLSSSTPHRASTGPWNKLPGTCKGAQMPSCKEEKYVGFAEWFWWGEVCIVWFFVVFFIVCSVFFSCLGLVFIFFYFYCLYGFFVSVFFVCVCVVVFHFPKPFLCFSSLSTILKENAKVWSWLWNTKILLLPFTAQGLFLNCLLSLPAACPTPTSCLLYLF